MQAFLAQDQELKEKAQRVSNHLQLLEACQLDRTAVRIIDLQIRAIAAVFGTAKFSYTLQHDISRKNNHVLASGGTY